MHTICKIEYLSLFIFPISVMIIYIFNGLWSQAVINRKHILFKLLQPSQQALDIYLSLLEIVVTFKMMHHTCYCCKCFSSKQLGYNCLKFNFTCISHGTYFLKRLIHWSLFHISICWCIDICHVNLWKIMTQITMDKFDGDLVPFCMWCFM